MIFSETTKQSIGLQKIKLVFYSCIINILTPIKLSLDNDIILLIDISITYLVEVEISISSSMLALP